MSTKINEMAESKVVIGELTSVRVGLLITFLTMFAGAVWWASSINTKLDSILSLQAATSTKLASVETEVSDLKLKLAVDESSIKLLQDTINISQKR